MTVYVATKNFGKLREFEAILASFGWTVGSFPAYRDVAEGDESYAANAALKARALRRQLLAVAITDAVLSDDSGLEVAALNGRPGIRSARFGGEDATWAQRRAAVLAEVAASGNRDRRARFVCALHHIGPDGSETPVERFYEGLLAAHDSGEGGFSYDPIFISPSHGMTFAELPVAEKNRISHRARAVSALAATLATRAGERAF